MRGRNLFIVQRYTTVVGVICFLLVGEEAEPGFRVALCQEATPEGNASGSREKKDAENKLTPKKPEQARKTPPKPPLSAPKTSAEYAEMGDVRLKEWVKTLTTEFQSTSNLSQAFARSVQVLDGKPSEVKWETISPKLKEYLEQVLEKPLEPGKLSKNDHHTCGLALAMLATGLGEQLSEALDIQYARSVEETPDSKKKGTENKGVPKTPRQGPKEPPKPPVPTLKTSADYAKMTDARLAEWVEALQKEQKTYFTISQAFFRAVMDPAGQPPEIKLEMISPQLKEYFEQVLEKPLELGKMSKNEDFAIQAALLGPSMNISNQLSEALMIKLHRDLDQAQ